MANLSVLLDELISTTEASIFTPGPDVLADYEPNIVVGWYERLALATQTWYANSRPGGGSSLSAAFLMHWRDLSRTRVERGQVVWNKTAPKEFDVVKIAATSPLREKLLGEVRPVFLTQRQRGHDANKGFGGAVRKLQEGWDGTPLTLTYKAGSVEGATNAVKAKLLWQLEINHSAPEEIDWTNLDIYASLHTFAVESTVAIRAIPLSVDPKRFTIAFDSWTWRVVDYYDWDPNKHNDMANPDYNKAGPLMVRPDLKYITVWHRNARRVEAANLATPFPVESTVHVDGPRAAEARRRPHRQEPRNQVGSVARSNPRPGRYPERAGQLRRRPEVIAWSRWTRSSSPTTTARSPP